MSNQRGQVRSIIDVVTNAGNTNTGVTLGGSVQGVRFNSNGGHDWLLTTSSSGNIGPGSILVTSNVGQYNVNVTAQGTISARGSNGADIILMQDNTAVLLNISANFTGNLDSVTKSGRGTLYLTGTNQYTLQTYLIGGTTMINANAALGSGTGSNATINLNNGALLGNGTFSLDNSGANPRGIVLTNAGGTLAASTGNTMTVSGVISGAAPVTFGLGTVAGTGAGTANPTAIVGDGTVILTGTNTYTGKTVVNGGTLTLNSSGGNSITSNNATGMGGSASNQALASDVQINSGTLLLGRSNQIVDTAKIALSGGKFDTAGYSEGSTSTAGMGALTLSANSILDFGSTNSTVVHFGASNGQLWSGTLSVYNWSGSANGGGADQLLFGTNTTSHERAIEPDQFLQRFRQHVPGHRRFRIDQ